MGISVTNSQGTEVYVCAGNVAIASYSDFDDGSGGGAKASAKAIGCVQDLGSINQTTNVQEYECLSSDDSTKILGTTKRGNFQVSMLFDALDTEGQAELRAMFTSKTGNTIVIQLNDKATTNPTIIVFDGLVSGQDITAQKDNAVMINSTVEIASTVSIINAA